jgi:hypothetical protein
MTDDFAINENDLDGEWLRQAALYNYWAGLAAKALNKQNMIDLQRKIMKAELYKEAKERAEKQGKKPTGADLEADLRTHKEYERLSMDLIAAQEHTDLMEAGKWAMVEKGKSLDRLCVDREKGFFMPSGSSQHNTAEKQEQQLKQVDKGLRDQMNKKKIDRG